MSNSENKGGRPAKNSESPFTAVFRQLVGDSTQQEIADKIGVSRQNVGKWLSGSTTPDIATLCKIADAYGVSTDYLLGRIKDPTTDSDLKAIYEDIGLTGKTIENIRQISNETVLELLNMLCETGEMIETIEIIAQHTICHCMMLNAAKLYKKLQQLNSDTLECECQIKEYRQNAGYFETSASMQIKTMLDVSRKYLTKTRLELNDNERDELIDLTNSFYKGKELNIDFEKLFNGINDQEGADNNGDNNSEEE